MGLTRYVYGVTLLFMLFGTFMGLGLRFFSQFGTFMGLLSVSFAKNGFKYGFGVRNDGFETLFTLACVEYDCYSVHLWGYL
jgi:hypothetical protein